MTRNKLQAIEKKVKKRKKSAKKSVTGSENHRKNRENSIENEANIATSLVFNISPPDHVRLLKRDIPFFNSIINEFASVDWSEHAIEIAAYLAKAMADLELETANMRREGSMVDVKVIVNDQPIVVDKKINPRKQLIDMHTKNIMALRRSLQLHGRGISGELRDAGKRRNKNKDLADGVSDFNNNMGLINRPMH